MITGILNHITTSFAITGTTSFTTSTAAPQHGGMFNQADHLAGRTEPERYAGTYYCNNYTPYEIINLVIIASRNTVGRWFPY